MRDARNLSAILSLVLRVYFFLLLTMSLDCPSTYVKDLRRADSLQVSYTRILHPSVANYLLVKLKILWTCEQNAIRTGPKPHGVYAHMSTSSFNAATPQPLINIGILSKRHLCSIIHSVYLTGILSFIYGSCRNTSMILSLSSWMPSMFLSFLKTFSNLL